MEAGTALLVASALLPGWVSVVMAVGGIVLMLTGGKWMIEGAIGLGRILNISQITIGLTLIAMGTSLPELAVNISASIKQQSDIVIGNVVGSNVFNITGILGIVALIRTQKIHSRLVISEFPLTILLGISLMAMVWLDEQFMRLSRGEAIVLLCFFLSFLYLQKFTLQSSEPDGEYGYSPSLLKGITLFVVGLILLAVGSELAVSGSVEIAHLLGVSEFVISVLLLAVGTSLPELVTSVIAILKGKQDIAVGNVVGSNIFNVAGIWGISGLINEIGFRPEYMVDIGVWIAVTLLLWLTGARRTQQLLITRLEGLLLLVVFVGYIAYIVAREAV